MKRTANVKQTRRPPKTGNFTRTVTARSSEHRQWFAGSGQRFKALDGTQKAAWQALSARLTGAGGGRVLSGREFYIQVAMGRLALGLTPLSDAPAVPTLPPFLPTPTVTASVTDGQFSLKLTGVDYPCAVQVSGWEWRVAGSPSPSSYRPPVLTVLPQLTFDGSDFGPVYAKRFWMRASNMRGMEVWLRLVGISSEGFRTPPLDVCGVVMG